MSAHSKTMNSLSMLKSHLHAACAAAALLLAAGSAVQAADLNALIWCDHADPALLQPFEEANGVKVNVKDFEGTGAGLAIVEQSQPGDWDVMVI
ncbi:spermidine/putrescine ABC transporter substrate-binding protein, partial [Mesorhizobium sp. M7A.F.Ca.CA.002.04.1.1]